MHVKEAFLIFPGKVLATEKQLFLINWKKILRMKQSFRSLKMVSKNTTKRNKKPLVYGTAEMTSPY